MNLWNYLVSSGVTLAIIIVLGWLGRKYLATFITEAVKTDFQKDLESFRTELRAKEGQIEALRGGALSGMVTRQTEQARRRMDAADKLWEAVNDYNKLSGAAMTKGVYNFDACSERIEKEPSLQQIFKMSADLLPDITELGKSAHAARPYLSDSTWALYQAYTSILMLAYSKMKVLAIGLDGRKFFEFKKTDETLIAALPDLADYIRQNGHAGHHHLLDVLSNRILEELRRTIEGIEQDQESVRRAGAVLKVAEEAHRALEEGQMKAERAAAEMKT